MTDGEVSALILFSGSEMMRIEEMLSYLSATTLQIDFSLIPYSFSNDLKDRVFKIYDFKLWPV